MATCIVYRNPTIEVHGETPLPDIHNQHIWALHPKQVSLAEKHFELTWLRPTMFPSTLQTPKIEKFKKHAMDLLEKPLRSLVYNSDTSTWCYIEGIEASLPACATLIADGFKYNMANCRGRAMVQNVLDELLGSENRKVINCGGSNVSNEPAVRHINFTFKQIPDDFVIRVSSQNLVKQLSPKEEELQEISRSHGKRFVPDIILEEKKRQTCDVKELLIVEVKSGTQLTHFNENQLKFQLLPSAIKQRSSLGLLICAKEAILMKYSVDENCLQLMQKHYEFHSESLLEDMIALMCDLHYHTTET